MKREQTFVKAKRHRLRGLARFGVDLASIEVSTDNTAASRRRGRGSRNLELMLKKLFLLILIPVVLTVRDERGDAQESPNSHVVVHMVQLNEAVSDKKGKYITGLQPKDYAIVEDGIVEKAATFSEGDEPARSLSEFAEQDSSAAPAGELALRSSEGISAQTPGSLVRG